LDSSCCTCARRLLTRYFMSVIDSPVISFLWYIINGKKAILVLSRSLSLR
jgi:hypothetical protein